MIELKLHNIKDTEFVKIYSKLLSNEILEVQEINYLLEIAVIFLNSTDGSVQKLGYRIIVLYSNKYKNYKPLYDVSLNLGYIPIAKSIESNLKSNNQNEEMGFFSLFLNSFKENFKKDNIYLTLQQLNLNESFIKEDLLNNVVVVAPTSYGKSELIISLLKEESENICIIVPTKTLIAQTKRRILKSQDYNLKRRIVTHPEMYNNSYKGIVAILTQERALRLMQKEKELKFSLVFIDEAHNLLEKDNRASLLASAIILLQFRNPLIVFKFLTPFLIEPSNIQVRHTKNKLKPLRIDEYLKTEKFFSYDFRKDNVLKFYDHYLDIFINQLDGKKFKDDIELIMNQKSKKNIIYLNRPKSIEQFSKKFAKRLPALSSSRVEKVCKELERYLHSDYSLISCLRHGIVYHHGYVPDNVKQYIEHLFSTEEGIEFIVTTSTLLEGVNIPAETLFILDNKRGRGSLSASQFKNLVGRICRFSEVFNSTLENLNMLEPKIYIIASEYIASNANIEKFLQDRVKIDKKIKDSVENVLLNLPDISPEQTLEREKVETFLENIQKGVIEGQDFSYADTDLGRSCFANNITELDILLTEKECEKVVIELAKGDKINNAAGVFNAIEKVFLNFMEDDSGYDSLLRLKEQSTKNFYTMFLNWRTESASFGEMINSFLKYWKSFEEKNEETFVFVGSKWGEVTRGKGFLPLWVDIKSKNNNERVNLAIVKIQEEQNYLDNDIMKFIEVLNDMNLLDNKYYEEIKYGTADSQKILLIKNGISIFLANLLIKKYKKFLTIDLDNDFFVIKIEIIEEMRKNDENEILVFETQYNIAG